MRIFYIEPIDEMNDIWTLYEKTWYSWIFQKFITAGRKSEVTDWANKNGKLI